MKKRTTLELVEQSTMDRTTEFELFLRKFEQEASLNMRIAY